MEWLTTLRGAVVGLDTAPLIYYIEENPDYVSVVQPFFEAMDRGEVHVVTSAVTLLEVLVHPLRRGDQKLADQYRDVLLNSKGLATVPMQWEIAERAAQLRAKYAIRTPDAIQVATSLHEGASFFLTSAVHLSSISELNVLLLNEL